MEAGTGEGDMPTGMLLGAIQTGGSSGMEVSTDGCVGVGRVWEEEGVSDPTTWTTVDCERLVLRWSR